MSDTTLTTTIGVQGMTCQGCVRSVTQALERVPGVKTAQVSLEQGQASVNYDPARTSAEVLKSAISSAGFDVS